MAGGKPIIVFLLVLVPAYIKAITLSRASSPEGHLPLRLCKTEKYMTQQAASAMKKTAVLKERQEANEFATLEFSRVKRAKLENERAKSSRLSGCKDDKQLDRERCNRASAAASRAKIVFYSKELEKRTDRLEMERNHEMKRADRATRKVRALQEEVRNLKKALRDIWGMKDQRTCSYLMDSEALFLLSSRQEDSDLSMEDSDSDTGEEMTTEKNDVDSLEGIKFRSQSSPQPKNPHEIVPKRSDTQLSTPFKTISTIRSLVNPTSVEPAVLRDIQYSPCASPSLKKFRCSLPLSSVTLHNGVEEELHSPRDQRSAMR